MNTLFASFCNLLYSFCVFLFWCFFSIFGFELRNLNISVLYILIVCIFHCVFFYIFILQLILFAEEIILTYEICETITDSQSDSINNSYLGVVGSYIVVTLYYLRICSVWGEYFDTRVLRVFLLLCFLWEHIPVNYLFSLIAPV